MKRFLSKSKNKYFLVISMAFVLVMMWSVASAESPSIGFSAHIQLRQFLPTLNDSEAEHVSGAYIPGMGAMITMDLLRGPNSMKDKAPEQGTRDWTIYLLQTFGAKLTAVPAEESIGFSVDFYDYARSSFRQLVVVSKASEIADPTKYKIYLDGKPYAEAASPLSNNTAAATTTAQATTAKATTGAVASVKPGTVTPGVTTTAGTTQTKVVATGQAAFTPGPVTATLDFADAQAAAKDWLPIVGTWEFKDQSYNQNDLGKFDLLSLFNRPLTGNYKLQTNMKYLQGDMGGGLVFNVPSPDKKNGGQMVSYTGKGTYLQWGYYDNSGLFQFQGGTAVPSGADGKPHTLAVKVTGNLYEVSLDGTVLGTKLPLFGTPGGYVGLLASTSQVLFDNVKIESVS